MEIGWLHEYIKLPESHRADPTADPNMALADSTKEWSKHWNCEGGEELRNQTIFKQFYKEHYEQIAN